MQLEQSPFLSIVPQQSIRETLQLMGRPADAKLTSEISQEVCQRTGSKAVIDGSIAQIGTQYSLILNAVNCSSGESLTSTEAQANDKNHLLDALSTAASNLRKKLGESLSTVQKFDTPLAQATTPSLEALQFYSVGVKLLAGADSLSAIPLFQQAIKLDPNFATAYLMLGASRWNLGELELASENLRKAYERREGVSERERLFIEAEYYDTVLGDLPKAQRAYEVVARIYPRYPDPHNELGLTYENLGQYEKAIAEFREKLRLDLIGITYNNYNNLARCYMKLNRFGEAEKTIREAQAKNIDTIGMHNNLYLIAFLRNDPAGMKQQADWAVGKPDSEYQLLGMEADTRAYSGRLREAREFSHRAVASTKQTENKELAAYYEAVAAVREALFGNAVEARKRAKSALTLSTGVRVQYATALAMALAGDAPRAQALADDLAHRFPSDTVVQFMHLPTLYAQIAIIRKNPSKDIEPLQAAAAVELLQAAAPYELGNTLYPVYVRGEAYLAAHQGKEAAVEFQKILDHRGIGGNDPIGALAHLQIGRAYAMQGDTAKARAAYQDFLTLWNDADPDIPILKQAKAECAKLQ